MTRRRIFLVLVGAIVVGLCAAAMLLPLDSLRGPLEAAVSRALGRTTKIQGHVHLAVYPDLGVSLKDVSIANNVGNAPMVTVSKIVVVAKLLPLLSGHLELAKLVLKQPTIHLEVGKDGVGNWQTAPVLPTASAAAGLDITHIRVENGDITYSDARSGKSETLSAVSLSLDMADAAASTHPANLDGTATYNSVPVKVTAKLDDVAAFLRGDQSHGSMSLSCDKFVATFTGGMKTPDTLSGVLKVNAPSIRALAAWAGQPMPPGNGFGAGGLEGTLSAASSVYSLTQTKITLDGIALAGKISVDTLHGNILKADLSRIDAYGGSGKGTLTLDASGAVPSLHETLDMSGIRTEQFFAQTMGIVKLSGSGAVHLDVAAHGRTEAEIITSLSGKGSVDVTSGAIAGADLGAVARLVQSTAQLLSGAVGNSARTAFSTLSSSFSVQNGVLRTSDFRLTGPTVVMTGAGTVNLSNRQIAFHLVPTAKLGVGGLNLVDIGIPFYARGTIDNPSFEPDPSGIAKGVVNTVGGTATQILDVPGNALKSLFGSGH